MKYRSRIVFCVFISLLLLTACSWNPEGVLPVKNFEPQRYLGRWYEIARLDHSFESGLDNVTAEYRRRSDGGIEVINRGFNKITGEWKQAIGKAYFTGSETVGQLRVSFFGPFYSGYNVIALDQKNYQYALVSGPNRNYLWVLSRTHSLDTNVLNVLLKQARGLGFDTDKLIFVQHAKNAEKQVN